MKNGLCPRTGEACPRVELCDVANAPLEGVVLRVQRETTGRGSRARYAAKALTHILTDTGDTLVADFAPNVGLVDAAICPSDVFERPLPAGVTAEQVAQGIGTIVEQRVVNLIADLNQEEATRARRSRM